MRLRQQLLQCREAHGRAGGLNLFPVHDLLSGREPDVSVRELPFDSLNFSHLRQGGPDVRVDLHRGVECRHFPGLGFRFGHAPFEVGVIEGEFRVDTARCRWSGHGSGFLGK